MIRIMYRPNSGHHTRATLLERAFTELGEDVLLSSRIQTTGDFDINVYDLPAESIPQLLLPRSVVMGTIISSADLCWKPLGLDLHRPNVLNGREYLMVDAKSVVRSTGDVVMYLGETHPLRNWFYQVLPYRILRGLSHQEFLDELGSAEAAILGWGQSCLEASMLQVPYLAIAAKPSHIYESWRFGHPAMPAIVAIDMLEEFETHILHLVRSCLVRSDMDCPRGGAERTAQAILEYFNK